MYAQLLIDLFKFLAPFLRNVELTKSVQILYKVSKREILVQTQQSMQNKPITQIHTNLTNYVLVLHLVAC